LVLSGEHTFGERFFPRRMRTPMIATETKTCPYCVEEIHVNAIKCKHCGSWLAPPPDPRAAMNGHEDPYFSHTAGKARPTRLTRVTGPSAMWAGVCAGFARVLGIDPTWVRVAVALATFFTALFPGLMVYVILSYVIPAEDSANA
jgi:phage shock protein C